MHCQKRTVLTVAISAVAGLLLACRPQSIAGRASGEGVSLLPIVEAVARLRAKPDIQLVLDSAELKTGSLNLSTAQIDSLGKRLERIARIGEPTATGTCAELIDVPCVLLDIDVLSRAEGVVTVRATWAGVSLCPSSYVAILRVWAKDEGRIAIETLEENYGSCIPDP